MGKPTGFLEFDRVTPDKEKVKSRTKHFKEFEHSFDEDTAKKQGARCMECGIPFCHGDTGCPVQNFIPEWNDLVYKGKLEEALKNLHSTNNFPEFTGRLCPAPCESACVLGINSSPVTIKSIEKMIIDKGFKEGWVKARINENKTSKKIAVIGSGPSGLAAAQQLSRAGHYVDLFEKNDRIGGLLRYGIPDFKLEKWLIDRRLDQMKAEGVKFFTGVNIGDDLKIWELQNNYDAIVLACGSESPRNIEIPGRELKGIHFAVDFLTLQNKFNAGDNVEVISAEGKNVIVLGGGDTGSDCIGTSIRQGAKSVTQLEIMPQPPKERSKNNPWPYWPFIFRTSSSQEEGAVRQWSVSTKKFLGDKNGCVKSLRCVKVEFQAGKFIEQDNSEIELPVELVLIAAGFTGPKKNSMYEGLIDMGIELDQRGNIKAEFGDVKNAHKTSLDKIFVCGDMRRGQSLIVWAIAEGRKCAESVNKFLRDAK
ncbi:MAG: glutamate synthase subunit beta [Ignavibacteriaceae bacterium]